MHTLSVDDRQLVVDAMQRILQRIDPQGVHRTATDPLEALRLSAGEPIDAAFLDVEMPGMDGLELARRLQEKHPLINIVFITGYEEYALQAFELYACGYLIKPITEKAVRGVLNHLRYQIAVPQDRPLKVRCFGTFEVFHQDRPLRFPRARCKELFAYLIDRRGAMCSIDMMIGNLWPEDTVSETRKSHLRVLIAEMTNTFRDIGAEDALIRDRGELGINVSRVDCDYYRYLSGDPYALHQFSGEYMTQYEFAEETRANLQQRLE
ncbi:MAG: response regulator [Clostridia bacterium]|nr:response regulator [Clostridia bacterium]